MCRSGRPSERPRLCRVKDRSFLYRFSKIAGTLNSASNYSRYEGLLIGGQAMPKILLAGNDFRLLGTRAAVLGRTGASVVCCSAVEASGIISTERFDLVVLCHTLSDQEAERMIGVIQRRWPGTRILQVVSDLWRDKFYSDSNVTRTTTEPSRLIRCTRELLETLPNHHIEEAAARPQVSGTRAN